MDAVVELRATGMPLGLLPGMTYDEYEGTLELGESLLIYSDGLVEAHNPQGEMFGFPRLRTMACGLGSGAELIEHLRGALADFTGPGWEQEDDVTFVTLERSGGAGEQRSGGAEEPHYASQYAHASRPSSPTSPSPARRTTSDRRWSGWRRQWRAGPAGRSAGAAEDRGGGGDHERHGARQPLRSRPAGRHPGARVLRVLTVSITDHGGGQDDPRR